ncbi:hypothetical protein Gotri_024806 [Gossypium trilobum]|uniref:RNase H type-1 domain-containing protein n=1 Tax=Gossypium trilobum TaxID=34281 RepID=A0A7J9FGR0_9ROSI|nr:hypothetical protein [Gossypium trilobum]
MGYLRRYSFFIKGFKRGTVQTDSLEVVRALQENRREDSGITMFRTVQRILKFEGQW